MPPPPPPPHLCPANLTHLSSPGSFKTCDLCHQKATGEGLSTSSILLCLFYILDAEERIYLELQVPSVFENHYCGHSQSVPNSVACDYVLSGVVLLSFLPQLENIPLCLEIV